MVTSSIFDFDARVRSYELLMREWKAGWQPRAALIASHAAAIPQAVGHASSVEPVRRFAPPSARDGRWERLRQNSFFVASFAPSTSDWNFASTMVGWTSGTARGVEAKPQSVDAIT